MCYHKYPPRAAPRPAPTDIFQNRFRSNVAKAPNKGRINAIKGDTLLSLSSLVAAGQSSSFDVIYIDASHEARNHSLIVLFVSPVSFRLSRPHY